MKRVVITGMGAVSPFGVGAGALWRNLLAGNNGIRKIHDLNIQGDIVGIAASMPEINYQDYQHLTPFDCYMPEDASVKASFLAVHEAICQSGIDFARMNNTQDTGCYIADRPLGATTYMDQYAPLLAAASTGKQLNKLHYFQQLQQHPIIADTQYQDPDSINHYMARVYGIQGPHLAIGTACASGNNAIGESYEKIRRGRLTRAIAGGAYNYDLTTMIGFTRIGALTSNPDPDNACRPFDLERSGFVMGSGCGVLILEDLDTAKQRGATILCEISGYGSLSDGYRATDPDPQARGATRTIAKAMQDAKLNPEQISYINAHGTSTKMNDKSETRALKSVLGDAAMQIPVSSSKSMIGHGIIAAGALESVACINSILDNAIHPTRNWKTRDPQLDLDYVPGDARQHKVDHVLSNNFGFGGQNATVIFSRFTG